MHSIQINKPQPHEHPEYVGNYIAKANWNDLFEAHRESVKVLQELLRSLSEEKWNFRYGPGKWSIKEIVGHLIDAERIMAFRALCFARREQQPLPGFEENDYAENSNASEREPADLLNELQHVRQSTIDFFSSLKEETFMNSGIANKNSSTVRAIAWMIPGHMMHHADVIKERYL
ncbi:MAG: DinB family protein [Chitinophagales bacterium]|nr:DinB family protein [Chitinophagales bacterium]